MIKAIIFDCFGVLATEGWLPFKKQYFEYDKALFDEATDLNKQADAGLIRPEDFINRVSELANVTPDELRQAVRHNVPDAELLGYIKTELKPKYKIGLLSNTSGDRLHNIFSDEQVALFDGIALSFETGAVKPEAKAYELAAERLGVIPEECVFIDDQERHCTGARESGMQAILYKDFTQMKRELEKILKEQ